jgi:AraC-like DNA-binding protein
MPDLIAVDVARIDWAIRTPDLRHFGREVGRRLKPFRFVSMAGGGHDAAMFRQRLAATDVMMLRYGNGVTIDAGRPVGLSLLQVPLTGSYSVQRGNRALVVPTRTAHLLPAGAPLVMEWSTDCLLLVMRLDPSIDVRHDRLAALDDSSLGAYLDFILAELVGGTLLADHALARATETMLKALLDARFGADGASTLPPEVRRAQALLLADSSGDLTDLARQTGSSPRTLYRRFQTSHGLSPRAWQRRDRLERARSALEAASAQETSVTAIALEHGFSHLGRFARAYRDAFGESPSATLRRPA